MFLVHAHSTITTTSKSFGVTGISIEGLEDYVDNEHHLKTLSVMMKMMMLCNFFNFFNFIVYCFC